MVRLDAVLGEMGLEAVGAVLGAREDQGAGGLVMAQEADEQLGLLLGGDGVDRLVDLVDRHGDLADLDAHGVVQGVAHGFEDAARHGGREEQGLALCRQLAR